MSELLAKIAFASCCRRKKREKQPAWRQIAGFEPDLLVLLGDNVYAEKKWNMVDLERQYQRQLAVKNFRLALSSAPYIATWDDHDLGPDNAKGATPKGRLYRNEARRLLLAYLKPDLKNRWNLEKSSESEIYCSVVVNRNLVIVLDGRYYREQASPGAEFLGVEQTRWLWDQLDRAKTQQMVSTIVCCGSTIKDGNGYGESVEDYTEFYSEFKKRFQQCPNPIFLSGDIHRNKIRTDHDGFVEVISSGVAQKRPREYFGLKFGSKDLDNWGQLEIYTNRVKVTTHHRNAKSVTFPFPLL